MKKLISIILSAMLLSTAFVLPVSAVDSSGIEYGNEIYVHTTNGVKDWSLIEYYVPFDASCEIHHDVFFGRAFYSNYLTYPYDYGYGIYDAALDRCLDFDEITDAGAYPDLDEVLDQFHVGQKIGESQIGENVLYFDNYKDYLRKGYFSSYADMAVKSYDELYYHQTNGETDWVLVQADSWFFDQSDEQNNPLVYSAGTDRVFMTENIHMPFRYTYGIYNVKSNAFIELDSSMTLPGLEDALDELRIGERVGDINGDGMLNINDVTDIQRCLAGLKDYPASDSVEAGGFKAKNTSQQLLYVSDYNLNGTRDIGDATMLQQTFAEFDGLFTGSVTVSIPETSPFYSGGRVVVSIYEGNKAMDNTIAATVRKKDGEAFIKFNPSSNGLNLYHRKSYKVSLQITGAKATVPFTVCGDGNITLSL